MVWHPRRILGIALEERSALVAEVRRSGRAVRLAHVAEFVYPDGRGPENPEAFGRALADFLRQERFTARAACVGVPARWLVSSEQEFPPAAPAALAGMVRLGAERSFAADVDDLAIDFMNGIPSPRGQRVLILALPRARMDPLNAALRAAGLRPKVLAPTALALAASLGPGPASGLLLSLRPRHTELVLRSGERIQAIRHLPAAPADSPSQNAAERGSEIADAILRLTALQSGLSENAAPRLVVWDGTGAGDALLQALAQRLGQTVEPSNGPSAPGAGKDAAPFAPALALALAGARGEAFPVNFLRSRLAPARAGVSPRRIGFIAAAGLAVAVAGVAYGLDWRAQRRESAALRQRLAGMQDDIRSAEALVNRVTQLRKWTDRRPRFLDPLRELTLAFPESSPIWITSLAMRDDELMAGASASARREGLHMVVSGKSPDERTVLDLLDRIRRNAAFRNVNVVYLRQAGGNSRETAFSMTFDYVRSQ